MINAEATGNVFAPLAIPLAEITKSKPLYESILLSVLDAILDRYERDPRYHFIDTKLSVITGQDFDDLNEKERKIRGKNVIYSWIQGRGLEASARHAEWLKSCSLLSASEKAIRIKRIKKMLREVTAEMESIRRRNGGKLYFCFNRAGQALESVNFRDLAPLKRKIPPGSNLSDLFYAKGLLAAAVCLGDAVISKRAMVYLKGILSDIEEEKIYNDQQPFDPKNRVRHVPGQHPQAQWMIGISALSLAGELTGEHWCFETGERFIRHILKCHLNLGQFPRFKKYDFFELADDNNQPCLQDGRILCDPGHALEFIGLALKLLESMKIKRLSKKYGNLFAKCRRIFPEMFIHCFQLGFNPKAGGICKAFDLVGRRPVNTDMPWWSLPETMRAGMELLALGVDKKYHRRILKIIALCSNSFLNNYVNPRVYGMAYQTRNAKGRVIDVIPATPDADPGYHTGLSIICFLEKLKPPELNAAGFSFGHNVLKSTPS